MSINFVLRSAIVLFVLFLALQLVRPELKNPPVTAELKASEEVKQVLRNSCYNCHSNETKLSWFDQVVPAYWLVAHDVKEARTHVNFSEIGSQPEGKQKATLFEAVNEIQLGGMPLPSYKRVHPGAVVTAEQLAVLRTYLTPGNESTAADPKTVQTADAQYAKWLEGVGTTTSSTSTALNGVRVFADYKDWREIDGTDRWDNGTMRVILGNPVAIKAVSDRINPWPDGAAFAKVTWSQQPDGTGLVRTGAFVQVEFMVKGSKQYAATEGWGFARFRGMDLKPYGTSANFTQECTGCHEPVRKSDFVYTMPLAALQGDLPANPLQWRVITSAISHSDESMSTLFGNDLAVDYSRTHTNHEYPAGAVLTLVTWKQREDARWFGGRIPGKPEAVEMVTVKAGPVYVYEKYEGTPLQKVSNPGDRAAYLLEQRAAVMP